MGMFDVQINKKIKLKKTNKDLFEFLKKQLLKNKDYENEITREELSIKKIPYKHPFKIQLIRKNSNK